MDLFKFDESQIGHKNVIEYNLMKNDKENEEFNKLVTGSVTLKGNTIYQQKSNILLERLYYHTIIKKYIFIYYFKLYTLKITHIKNTYYIYVLGL
jgi:hypothetical protein